MFIPRIDKNLIDELSFIVNMAEKDLRIFTFSNFSKETSFS